MQRVDMHRLQELVRLHRMGSGCREVARLLGLSPNTERLYRLALQEAGLLEGDADALPELEALRSALVELRGQRHLGPARNPVPEVGLGRHDIIGPLRFGHARAVERGSLSRVEHRL